MSQNIIPFKSIVYPYSILYAQFSCYDTRLLENNIQTLPIHVL